MCKELQEVRPRDPGRTGVEDAARSSKWPQSTVQGEPGTQLPKIPAQKGRDGRLGWGKELGMRVERGALRARAPRPRPTFAPLVRPCRSHRSPLTALRSPDAPGTGAAISGGSGSQPLGSRKRESGSDRRGGRGKVTRRRRGFGMPRPWGKA